MSGLKKLAGRNYEDILQVRDDYCSKQTCTTFNSVLSRSLRVYCLLNMTQSSLSYFLNLRHGMALLSSVYTLNQQSMPSTLQQHDLEKSYASSSLQHVRLTIHMNSLQKMVLVDENTQPYAMQIQCEARRQRFSTSIHPNFMHLVDM